jgi:hypothetical protein
MNLRILGITTPDSKQSPTLITPFTGIHFLSGAAVNLISRAFKVSYIKSFVVWFILHLLYELKDFHGSYVKNSNDYYGNNSIANSIADQVFAMLGFIIGQTIPLSLMVPFITIFVVIVVIAHLMKLEEK